MPDGSAIGVNIAPMKTDAPLADAPGIPVENLDASALPPKFRFDAWRAATEQVVRVTPFDAESALAGTSITAWLLDDLVVAETTHCAQTLERTPHGRFTAANGCVRLRLCTGGRTHFIIGDDISALEADEIHILDYTRPFREVSNESYEQFGVFLTHAAIGYDAGRHPPHIRIGLDTPVGRVLADALLSLRSQLGQVDITQAPALARGLTGLVAGLVFPGQDADASSVPVQAARRQAMRAFLDRNLRDSEIGIAALARSFGAARATIYRDFAEDGGVDRYVTRRRLERAFVELADRPAQRGVVQAVALSYGFADLNHFSRLFKGQFGVPPSDVLALGGRTADLRAAEHGPAQPLDRTVRRLVRIIGGSPFG